jgi:hypothetical protein
MDLVKACKISGPVSTHRINDMDYTVRAAQICNGNNSSRSISFNRNGSILNCNRNFLLIEHLNSLCCLKVSGENCEWTISLKGIYEVEICKQPHECCKVVIFKCNSGNVEKCIWKQYCINSMNYAIC